ncbi:MAG: FixH family protein [bacterium]|nr:FixH family protein [bacterium]
MTDITAKPWYRQFWPWFIMALPATAVVAGLSTVYIAFKNQDSLVRDDWYQDGKSINLDMAREKRAQLLGMSADMAIDALTGDIRVTLHEKQTALLPPSLKIAFSHVTRADLDQAVTLQRQHDGEYHGVIGHALRGHFDIELAGNDWRITDSTIFPLSGLHLEPH